MNNSIAYLNLLISYEINNINLVYRFMFRSNNKQLDNTIEKIVNKYFVKKKILPKYYNFNSLKQHKKILNRTCLLLHKYQNPLMILKK